MPDQPIPGDERFWCPVCLEHIAPGYEEAHAHQPAPGELEAWLEHRRQAEKTTNKSGS